MYVTQSAACDLPNSASPLTQAQIDAQAARINRVGAKFLRGNQAMSAVIASLTPPPPTGTCDDFTTSLSMRSSGRMVLNPRGRGRIPISQESGMGPDASATAFPAAAIAPGTAVSSPDLGSSPALPLTTPTNSGGVSPVSGAASVIPPTGVAPPIGGSLSGGNPSGVNYPWGGVQDALQAIVPADCGMNPGGGFGPATPNQGTSPSWGILGLVALALFALGYQGDGK